MHEECVRRVLRLTVCLGLVSTGISLISAGLKLVVLGLEVLHGLHHQRRELAIVSLRRMSFGTLAWLMVGMEFLK